MAATATARETLCALRRQIARIEGTLPERLEAEAGAAASVPGDSIVVRRRGEPAQALVPSGAARFDAALGGGVPVCGLIEIHSRASRDAGASAGVALALAALARRAEPSGAKPRPLVWVGTAEIFREAGRPYAPGLAWRFGIAPESLLTAEAERTADMLWIAEEAAALDIFASVIVEVRGDPRRLDLTATRRLHRRAKNAGHPVFLLRQAGAPTPTAAPLRLIAGAAAAAPRSTLAGALAGSIGPPAFHIAVDKALAGRSAAFTLEWNREARAFKERDHEPVAKIPVAVAAASFDRAHPAPSPWPVLAFPPAA